MSFLALASPSFATVELDRQYSLHTIGFLRSYDNVDGLFAEYVATAYKEYFTGSSRFVLQDLGKADAILTESKLPYQKVIDDPQVLSQVSRATKTESLIRTKIRKEGPLYRFNLEWLHSPGMDVMATETFTLEQITEVKPALQKAVDSLIKKVPFVAQVTGRDNNSITVNIGKNADLKPGDTLMVSTIDEVKRHPLLRSVVGWTLNHTGKVEIDQVDEGIAFGKVLEEEPGKQIARYQKVVQIIPKPVTEKAPIIQEKEDVDNPDEPPKLGWAAGGLWVGSLGREYSVANGSGQTGSGMLFGAKFDGQLWLTRKWFSELGFGFGSAGYSQRSLAAGSTATASSFSASTNNFKFALGYSYLITGDMFGPKGYIKVGYRSTSYTLPADRTNLLAPNSFKGFLLGVGGDLPVRSNIGVQLSLDLGLLTSVSETGDMSGVSNGSTDVSFFVGGYYRLSPRMSVRAGVDVVLNSADFGTGSTAVNLSQKVITFTPALLYYF